MAKRIRKRPRQRRWTKAEVRQLKVLARHKMPVASVARVLNRSLDSTKRKASTLGVSLGTLARWTEQDRRRLKALAREKRPIPYIAKRLKRTELAIEKAASNFGISLDMRD